MLTPEALARLAALNRQSLPKPDLLLCQDVRCMHAGATAETRAARESVASAAFFPAVGDGRVQSRPPPASLSTAQPLENSSGIHVVIRRLLSEVCPAVAQQVEPCRLRWSACCDAVGGELNTARAARELAHLRRALPAETLFLDLETCGFSGSPVFLAGVIHAQDGPLILEQYLARDYSEEAAVLTTVAARCKGATLVTFNGKSFDGPMVTDRSIVHHLAEPLAGMPHVDLLHHARRHWRKRLPNFRLQTLERFVCGRMRQGDIPGSRIGAEYHAFVRTCDPAGMESILHHNALDLVTLVQLALRLCDVGG